MHRTIARLCTTVLLCTLATVAVSAQRTPRRQAQVPTLTTARTQYAPGTLAVFSGTGFLPGEFVQMVVSFANGAPLWSDQDFWNTTADASGRFTTSWLTSTEEGVGSELSVIAYGGASGAIAGTTMLLNHDCGTGVLSALTPVGGSCSAFTPAQGNGPDNYEVEEGGTYTMTITGVTECTGSTITIFVQSSSTGNFCFNAVGGSGTYSGTFTMPNPACKTMPVSYKCGANATCNHPGSLGLQGPHTGCGGVHLRASFFDGNCHKTGTDNDCNASTPKGACCLSDGSCVEVTEDECSSQGGTYQGDHTDCSSANCSQPKGACCLADGSCVLVTEDECSSQGGTYQGDHTDCSSANCPQPKGACCLADGSCVLVTEDECSSQGGTYQGDHTDCSSANCPQPKGACCLADGSCVLVTEDECSSQGGTYQGDHTDCSSANCPQPAGACCLTDGSCVEVTEDDCFAMGGQYNGDNTSCASVNCPFPAGACCLADGSCVQVPAAECASLGGTYGGDGSMCKDADCPQPPGACCLFEGLGVGGPGHARPARGPRGAQGDGSSCVEVTEEECVALGGVFQGDGTTCAGVQCVPPTGACCLADGSCVEVSDMACAGLGGTYYGDGSECADTSCPQPTGACCLAEGECAIVTEEDCLAMAGIYQGDFSLCMDVSCPQPLGACCLADGSCVEVTEEDCAAQGGTFYGDHSVCASTSCPQPTGACCLTNELCVEVTEEDCATQGGVYFGDGSVCGSTNCDEAFPDCFTLGFDTDDDGNAMPHGAKVDLEYDCNGSVYPIAITGSVNFSGQNTAAILDSTNGPATQDPDLLVGKGNILILQNDSNLTQCPANSGVYCTHNDDEHGGTLTFTFCLPASPSSITLIDQDLSDPVGSSLVLTDGNGKTRTYTVPANWTGDKITNFPQPGWKALNLTTMANQPGFGSTATASEQVGYDPNAVVSLTVTFGGSGGVDDLIWCQ